MKQIAPTNTFRSLLVAVFFALAFSGCGNLENFDADDFDLFGKKEDKENFELRRYAEPGMSNMPLIEFISDAASSQSVRYGQHLRKICDYTKLPYRTLDQKTWDAAPSFASSTRVVCILETKKLSQASINKFVEFVANGGTLFIPFASEDYRISYLLGFKPNAEFATDAVSSGFHFKTPFLPNMKGHNDGDSFVHYGFAKENFSKNVRILMNAVNNPEYPLVTENRIGKGRVLFYNTSDDFEKIDRGFLFAGLLKGLEGIPYPIANTSTIFLDDFPSPLYDIKSEPILSEMDMDIKDFVKKVWWPDMQALAKKYKISYSAMTAFDYKNKVEPPFIFDQWDVNKIRSNKKVEPISDWLMRDISNTGHELAFHGYNHVSLTTDLWPNQQFVVTALNAAQKKWEVSNYGALPVTYVPPSNIIDKQGVELLKTGFPALKYMCSLYLGEIGNGGDREFDFDPYNKDFFDYPRISSGFYLNSKMKYSHESMYLYTGIWTHFVHPDDVYQIPGGYDKSSQGAFELRNGRALGWRKTKGKDIGLFTELDNYLQEMTTAFPQMRFLNAGESGAIVNDWRASRFKHHSGEGYYSVAELNPEKSLSNNQYWFMYASNENASKIEFQLKNESVIFSKTPLMDGFLYTIYTNQSKLTLRDLQYNTPEQLQTLKQVSKKVLGDYKKYLTGVSKFIHGEDTEIEEDEYEKKMALELKTLHTKMLSEAKIDSVTWNKYAKYMSWEDKGLDVWKMLEEHVVKYPSKENVMYSNELSKIVYYPNELSREKWMNAQMLVTPNDKDLLNSYVADFYTPENQARIRTALQNLLKVDTSFDTYLKYIEHLLAYDPPAAIEELAEKKPTPEYKNLATDITWLYANSGLYQKAYDWSQFSDEIDFPTKMEWLIELRSDKVLEADYKKYIAKNPGDYKTKAAMANRYYELGRFKDSWVLANSLPESPEKDVLRKLLNGDVEDVADELRQDLLANHSELFLPDVKDRLTKLSRKETGNFIDYKGIAETNKEDPSVFKNVLSYNFYDKKKNLHSIAGTYSTMYKVNIITRDRDNLTHAIGGIQYQFNNPKMDEKLQYWSSARLEYSDYEKFYYHFGAGLNFSKEKNYKSAEFRLSPMETGPSYSKRIYRAQLNLHQDFYFMKYFNGSISLEGNYYTASKPVSNVTISESYEGSVTGKVIWDNGVERQSKFLPFMEASKSQASIGRTRIGTSLGYPYWMIDDRLYGGGGLGWKYGFPDTNLITRLEAGWFFDDYSTEFQRYLGEVAYQIFDYTLITASFEIYAQSKFYSNAVQFGVKYNLKKRAKK